MRAVVQRVTEAEVTVEGRVAGKIGPGLLILLAVAKPDTRREADYMADKVAGLRVFADDNGKLNRSVLDAGGSLLVVSQFTLYGDVRRGRRPSFDKAAEPQQARTLYEHFVKAARGRGVLVETGVFQEDMRVRLVNDGPVTIIIDTSEIIT
jgi:D-tyrosyl-tRNA(Tyr) deacylase